MKRIIKFIPNNKLIPLAVSGILTITSYVIIAIVYDWKLAALIFMCIFSKELSKLNP